AIGMSAKPSIIRAAVRGLRGRAPTSRDFVARREPQRACISAYGLGFQQAPPQQTPEQVSRQISSRPDPVSARALRDRNSSPPARGPCRRTSWWLTSRGLRHHAEFCADGSATCTWDQRPADRQGCSTIAAEAGHPRSAWLTGRIVLPDKTYRQKFFFF
ncbi:hypothetical protein ACRAWF_28155, partial [Streptomyces sp. L7]